MRSFRYARDGVVALLIIGYVASVFAVLGTRKTPPCRWVQANADRAAARRDWERTDYLGAAHLYVAAAHAVDGCSTPDAALSGAWSLAQSAAAHVQNTYSQTAWVVGYAWIRWASVAANERQTLSDAASGANAVLRPSSAFDSVSKSMSDARS